MGSDASVPFVSVVIPVYNDTGRLKKVLSALRRQTYPKERYEVIVSDNASTEDVRSVTGQFPGVVYTYEAKRGPAAARNKGIRTAKGEIIAFTDSDCEPAVDWLEKGVQAVLRDPECGFVGGEIETFFKDPKRPRAVEILNQSYFKQKELVENRGFAATANLLTRRDVFQAVGVFNETFLFPACEDREWGERVTESGRRGVYAEDAVVRHPLRHSLKDLYRQVAHLTLGNFHYEKIKGRRSSMKKEWAGFFRPPVRSARTKLAPVDGVWSKTKLYGVILFSHYTRVLVRVRLKCGWKPKGASS